MKSNGNHGAAVQLSSIGYHKGQEEMIKNKQEIFSPSNIFVVKCSVSIMAYNSHFYDLHLPTHNC